MQLGTNYRFTTSFLSAAPVVDGVLRGLALVGLPGVVLLTVAALTFLGRVRRQWSVTDLVLVVVGRVLPSSGPSRWS